jgi:hypothetical protein
VIDSLSTKNLEEEKVYKSVLSKVTANEKGLAMGWKFIMSSPEPKLNIVTKDEDNN